MYPYIYSSYVCTILTIMINITGFIRAAVSDEYTEGEIMQAFFAILVWDSLSVYLLMVVISHCQKLIAFEKHGVPILLTAA